MQWTSGILEVVQVLTNKRQFGINKKTGAKEVREGRSLNKMLMEGFCLFVSAEFCNQSDPYLANKSCQT